MQTGFEISAVLNLHREGLIALPSIRSYLQCCAAAEADGIPVERIVVLDRGDEPTRRCLAQYQAEFQRVEPVDFGDVGLARNHAVALASGNFVAFFDGDDLWGSPWLRLAFRCAFASSDLAAYHPAALYMFHEGDFNLQSQNDVPHERAQSYFLVPEDSARIDTGCLYFDNVWSAHSFARRELYRRFPYDAVDREQGFGIEDWSWNHLILRNGIEHRIVPDTLHLYRMKEQGSLNQANWDAGLLPRLRD
ncbi:MAG: glycosyltransferase family 2 protein [Nevskia sp.]|nr:glycosyltransferase family 2 protein [Nevskia sp.]